MSFRVSIFSEKLRSPNASRLSCHRSSQMVVTSRAQSQVTSSIDLTALSSPVAYKAFHYSFMLKCQIDFFATGTSSAARQLIATEFNPSVESGEVRHGFRCPVDQYMDRGLGKGQGSMCKYGGGSSIFSSNNARLAFKSMRFV